LSLEISFVVEVTGYPCLGIRQNKASIDAVCHTTTWTNDK
jgi:hypothetical protein